MAFPQAQTNAWRDKTRSGDGRILYQGLRHFRSQAAETHGGSFLSRLNEATPGRSNTASEVCLSLAFFLLSFFFFFPKLKRNYRLRRSERFRTASSLEAEVARSRGRAVFPGSAFSCKQRARSPARRFPSHPRSPCGRHLWKTGEARGRCRSKTPKDAPTSLPSPRERARSRAFPPVGYFPDTAEGIALAARALARSLLPRAPHSLSAPLFARIPLEEEGASAPE